MFDQIFVKLADKKHSHKIWSEFDFGPDWIIHFGVTHASAMKNFPLYLHGENVRRIATSLLIGSLSILQVTKTVIKS